MEVNVELNQGWTGGTRLGEMVHATLRGAVGAAAMTGLRTFTLESGLLKQSPPQAIANQRKTHRLLKRIPRKRRVAVIEFAHWAYGAVGGTMFGALPESFQRRLWAGPVYGILVWLGFELGVAPLLGLKHAKELRLVGRIALATDHVLYGVVLSEMRVRHAMRDSVGGRAHARHRPQT